MTQKQRDKHHAAKFAVCKLVESSELDAAPPSPDGLGLWKGGRAVLNSPTFGLRAKPQRTADAKNAPGTDYASKINATHQREFHPIHTDANGEYWMYNRKTDKWDIPYALPKSAPEEFTDVNPEVNT